MEFSTIHWANHQKGESTRQKILEGIESQNLQTIGQISTYIGRCERQTKRQIQTLIREGRLIRINGRLILNKKNTYMAS